MNNISHIKITGQPNLQGISRLSLIAIDTVAAFDYPNFSFHSDQGPELTWFQLTHNSSYWSYIWLEDTPGLSHLHDLSIESPANAIEIEHWIARNQNTRFMAYIVINNGEVYLLGTPDQPFRMTGARSVNGLNQFILSFSCHATDYPAPLFGQAVPHFLTIP